MRHAASSSQISPPAKRQPFAECTIAEDVARELRFDLEARTAALDASDWSQSEARQEAVRLFGD